MKDSRKIAAILAADVVEYSRLMDADERGTLGAFKIRRAIFGRLVQEFDGQEFGSVGDSLMAQFPSATNAVRCALNLQHAIAEENDSLPADRRMGLRIGVNLADVIEENGALFGEGVSLDDIFVVQDDIAAEVVKALQVTLLGTALATRSKPPDPEAYNLALQGRYLLERSNQENLERSIDFFRQSLERDPGYAPAWAGLSRAYAYQAGLGFVPVAEGYRRAREAVEKALALDQQLADAYLAMGWIHILYDWDWAAADASFRKALELEPGNALVLRGFGVQAALFGRWDEAIDATNKAIERDPLGSNSYANLASVLLAVNRDPEAESAYRKVLDLDPGGASSWHGLRYGRILLLLGKPEAALQEMQQETEEAWRLAGLPLVYHALGRRSESDAALADLKSKYAGEMAYLIADVHAFRGEADQAFEWLERAYDQRDSGLPFIKSNRLFRTLIDDPRYKAFLKKMKLPE